MEQNTPQTALAQADALAERTRRSARWLARYYVVFGVSSLAMALSFGLLSGAFWAIVLSAIWVVLVVAISIYAARQQTMVRGGGRIHAGVMVAWTMIWVLTVTIGADNRMPWPWWLAGGLGMLVASLIGAWVVVRRTRSTRTEDRS